MVSSRAASLRLKGKTKLKVLLGAEPHTCCSKLKTPCEVQIFKVKPREESSLWKIELQYRQGFFFNVIQRSRRTIWKRVGRWLCTGQWPLAFEDISKGVFEKVFLKTLLSCRPQACVLTDSLGGGDKPRSASLPRCSYRTFRNAVLFQLYWISKLCNKHLPILIWY